MHVMIATDGSLDADRTARLAARLAGDDGRITVYTAIEVPRKLLDEMRRAVTHPTDDEKIEELSVEYRHDQAGDPPVTHWVGDDAVVNRYVERHVRQRTEALAAALEPLGIPYEVVGEEGEHPARLVLEAVKANDVDVLCLGTHGLGRWEGLLGSISTKLSRLAPCPVMLVR